MLLRGRRIRRIKVAEQVPATLGQLAQGDRAFAVGADNLGQVRTRGRVQPFVAEVRVQQWRQFSNVAARVS